MKSAPQKALEKLNLVRDIDLALHLPLRYEDETRITPIADLREGESAQVEGVVGESKVQFRPRRQLVVRVADGSDELVLRFLNFYPSHQKTLAVGRRVRVRGEARGGFLGREMVHPEFRAVDEGAPLPDALTPVYPTTAGLPQSYLRKAVTGALARAPLEDFIPTELLPKQPAKLPSLRDALHFLHHPGPEVALATLEDRSHPAWQRLKMEELLAQQLSAALARQAKAQRRASALQVRSGGLHEKLLAVLPFQLTAAQRRVGEEIAQDLARAMPMHRLLQGDVGSGKTVVAALAAAVCIDAGFQCALMAPTEILAAQHVKKLVDWLMPLGVNVAWLAGGQKKKERDEMLARIASGAAQLIVGTHAIIQDKVSFHKLALTIIDEQHRFGVEQRLALREKAGKGIAAGPPQGDAAPSGGSDPRSGGAWGPVLEPHLLMMSATPIPRTLAMSYYADLDVSTLDELPPGRTPIVTRVVAESRRHEVVARIGDQVAQGRQVYWVCPLIEESEAIDLRNATATHEELSAALPGVPVGLLHSRMPATDKQAVMADFIAGRMSVLVSTTVIEVGVDVPNATLMVIEHAERFGLSQLHQLRGRVGRGASASACVLLYSTGEGARLGEQARERLKAMAETNDGFEIARRDLEIRGPGEFLGARQSGAALLRFADPAADGDLLDWARRAAPRLLAAHPDLAARHVARWLGGRVDYLKA